MRPDTAQPLGRPAFAGTSAHGTAWHRSGGDGIAVGRRGIGLYMLP